MAPKAGEAVFRPIPLWEVVDRPDQWDKLSTSDQASSAAVLMATWLWQNKSESAVILFFVAGETELWDMVLALHTSDALWRAKFDWEVRSLSGETPKQKVRELRERLDEMQGALFWVAQLLQSIGVARCQSKRAQDHGGSA